MANSKSPKPFQPVFMRPDVGSETDLDASQKPNASHSEEGHDKVSHAHHHMINGRAEMKFPCEFMIKAIGIKSDDLAQHAHSLVSKHAPELTMESISVRASSQGKYLSVSMTINAVSREQLDSIYSELSGDPRILYTL